MSDSSRADKVKKVHGTLMRCPSCGNTNGPFNPDLESPVVVMTCPACGTKFDGDGGTGPFTVTCAACNSEQPFSNEKCFMCHMPLNFDKAVVMHAFTHVRCRNCNHENRKGSIICYQCGQHIDPDGNVFQVRVH